MAYSQLMPFYVQAIRLCKEQGSATVLASVAAFGELSDLAARLYRHMELLSALDIDQRCFKVRMYLHLRQCIRAFEYVDVCIYVSSHTYIYKFTC